MANPLNSTKGAELIEAQTGRRCTRQNLDKLCERGALRGSPCILQAKPLRVDADLLVSEYLAKVGAQQAEAQQPRAKREPATPQPKRQPAASAPPPEPAELPDYNISRARSEYEKANLLELDRKTKEGHLLRREDVEQAWGGAVNITRTRLLGVASTARQRIPHLETEEVELITTLIREALEELAAGELKQ
jgi:phage terminase Nu1 subunit (DNA packaging protein)